MSGFTSAWYNVPWAVISGGVPQSVKTKVDTGSDHSMIQYRNVKQLGLERFPVLGDPFLLKGFGGGCERIIEFVWLEVECPLIELGRVTIPMYVTQSKEIDGLLIGTPMIDEYELDRKILAAKDRHHGGLPPGWSTESSSSNSNTVHTLYDDRNNAIRKRDEEIRSQGAGERIEAISSIMRAKQASRVSPVGWTATSSSTASHSSSRVTTWKSTNASADSSTFSAGEDAASTVATSVSSASAFRDTVVEK
ncbi:hypothetical protein B0H67DRAFT_554005 [Lasiosphaeris hirsuta]|uniref:Peptidase A2 domain-containing protein n=1 Tax=Lasiosphaeris hirsuta TaxID=260670 RepID=A0AA40DVX5_9PEZI|nr:hypothetical protein B0H67DRAFT_554005 [Lasiosphaeris hirsuta]